MPASVLIVHAASDDREMYAEYLTAEGFRVIEAATTDAALPLVADVDLVVTGLLVPGSIDPIDLITMIRQDKRSATKSVIVLTASTFSHRHERARRAGADVVLLKPCLPNVLASEIRQLMTHRQTAASNNPPIAHEDRRKVPDRRAQWRGGRRDSDWQGRHRTAEMSRAENLLWFRKKHAP